MSLRSVVRGCMCSCKKMMSEGSLKEFRELCGCKRDELGSRQGKAGQLRHADQSVQCIQEWRGAGAGLWGLRATVSVCLTCRRPRLLKACGAGVLFGKNRRGGLVCVESVYQKDQELVSLPRPLCLHSADGFLTWKCISVIAVDWKWQATDTPRLPQEA